MMNDLVKYLINQIKLFRTNKDNLKREIQLDKLKRCVAIVGDDRRGKSIIGNKIINELNCDLRVEEIYLFNYYNTNNLTFNDNKIKIITEKKVFIRLRHIREKLDNRLKKLVSQIKNGNGNKCKDKYMILYFYNMFDIVDSLDKEKEIEYYSIIEEIILKANKLNIRVIYETYSLLNKYINLFIKEQTKIEILVHSKQNVITPFLNDILSIHKLTQKELKQTEAIIINRNINKCKKVYW